MAAGVTATAAAAKTVSSLRISVSPQLFVEGSGAAAAAASVPKKQTCGGSLFALA
jgi:hypothetical protein